MPRAADITLDDEDMSFLLIGENGSHKTRFLGSIPFPVYVFDFDKGLASARDSEFIEYDTFKDAAPGTKPNPKLGIYEYGTAWLEFVKKFNSMNEQIVKGERPFRAYAIDSYTQMSEMLENRIAKVEGRIGKPLEIQHWQTFNRDMRNAINSFIGWPGVKIVTAHVERAENPLTQSVEQLPLANAKMQGLLPNFFDEVYFCDVTSAPDPKDPKKKVQVPVLHTVKDTVRKNARSRWFVPQGTPTNWTSLIAAIRSAAASK